MGRSLTEGKYITFKVSTYLLALPIDSVFRVITCPSDLGQTLQEAKLAQMGDRTVMLLNLRAFLDPLLGHVHSGEHRHFLIITQGLEGELYGILVDAPPNLLNIPETSIQPVPQSFHQIGFPAWVSQIAILKQKNESTTILMLDIYQAVTRKSQDLELARHNGVFARS